MNSNPPPIPPRSYSSIINNCDNTQNSWLKQINANNFQPSYFGSGTSGYSMFDPYNRMTIYNNGLNNFLSENNFLRFAEESSKGAFQSIESIASAVTSLANMLNSVHSAIFNSFRAVIGVVEQFQLVKSQAAYLTLSILHFFQRIWFKILIFLRFRPKNFVESENVWKSIIKKSNSYGSNWSTLFFWIIALGGPYFIYKCVTQMIKNVEKSRKWATGNDEHYVAQALYNFNASNNQELSFNAQEMLRIAPKEHQPKVRDWLLASSINGERIGLVPANYIKLITRNFTTSSSTVNNSDNNHINNKGEVNTTNLPIKYN